MSLISVLTVTGVPSSRPSTLVLIVTLAYSSLTYGVVIYVPHIGIWTFGSVIYLTLRYRPAPGYHLDDRGLFSRKTARSLLPS